MTGPVLFLLFTYAASYAAILPTIAKLPPDGERRIQFSVRTLLIVTTCCAMLLASHIWLLAAIKSQ